jgi:hypothetical protein
MRMVKPYFKLDQAHINLLLKSDFNAKSGSLDNIWPVRLH